MVDCITNQIPALQRFCDMSGASTAFWFGIGQTPVGPAVLVAHDQTLLALWLSSSDPTQALTRIAQQYQVQVTRQDHLGAQKLLDRIFQQGVQGVAVGVSGSEFDLEVWRALCLIEKGKKCTYGELATRLGRPGAARAVGSALARNLVGYVIPCHRVVRQGGSVGQFRWGSETKQALQDWELN